MFKFPEEKNLNHLVRNAFPEVFSSNNELVTQKEAAQICNLDVKTIRKWQLDGELPFERAYIRFLHFQNIKLIDLMKCYYMHYYIHDPCGPFIEKWRKYYQQKSSTYPDCLFRIDIEALTGYGKTSVTRWLNKGYLKGYIGKLSRVPKQYFLDFVCSSHYLQITRPSKEHEAIRYNKFRKLKKAGMRKDMARRLW